MVLSHYFLAIIASPIVKEPMAVAVTLREGETRRSSHRDPLLRGLDDLPPTIENVDARHLPQAVLAIMLSSRAGELCVNRGLTCVPGAGLLDGEEESESRCLAQHIALSNIIPFRGSVDSPRKLTSIRAVARSAGATACIHSVQGAPALVVEAPGGSIACGYLSTVALLRPVTRVRSATGNSH